jgi:hypothetical protein
VGVELYRASRDDEQRLEDALLPIGPQAVWHGGHCGNLVPDRH